MENAQNKKEIKLFVINAKAKGFKTGAVVINVTAWNYNKTEIKHVSLEQQAGFDMRDVKRGDFIAVEGYFLKGGRFVATNARYLKQAGKQEEAAATAA